MKPIVIDASMAANWELDDEKNAAASRILEDIRPHPLLTTSIFWHEMRSIFLASEKRGRIEQGEPIQLLQHLRALGIHEQPSAADALILNLARDYALSAYDAAYLALAIHSDAILATNDRQLARAAIAAKVELRTALDRSEMA